MLHFRVLAKSLAAVAVLALAAAVSLAADDKEKTEPDVIFVPTPHEVVEKMLEIAKVTSKDVVYDLGCGDGRIVLTAARKHGARAKGFDIDPERIKECTANYKKEKESVQKLAKF